MKTSLLVRALVAVALVVVGLGSLLGCGVTLQELQARNPQAKTLLVHCRPWQVPEHVKLIAALSSADQVDHITTDEKPGELLEYASRANVLIEINPSAPPENAQIMASEYGLVCEQDLPVRSTLLEALREEKPCSMQANIAGKSNYLGTTNPQPCNPGAGGPTNGAAGSASAALPRIGVCTHPDGITSDTWYGGPGVTAGAKTQAEFDAQVAKATVIFFFDKSAPPESVWHFGPNIKARCPGKAPMPYAQWVAQNGGTSTQQAGSGSSGTGKQQAGNGNAGTGTAGTNTTAANNNGGGKKSATSSTNGQGKALSIFEQIANGMIVAGALAQGNTSASLDQAGGHRNGMPGGQNVGGFSFPLLQAGAATFQILNGLGVSVSPKKFFTSIFDAAKNKGQRTIIEKTDKAALDFADDLVKNHGQYEMAKGLEEMQTVMPYEMASKFTKGLEGKFQAHKIFERQALEKLTGRKDFEKLPSVVLTKEEHQEITNALAQAWKTHGPKKQGEALTADHLRKIYNDAYLKKYPQWLEIIEKQLRKV